MKLLLLIIVWLSFLASDGQPAQWTVESGGNGHWYQAVATCPEVVGVTWNEAAEYAQRSGTHLATISSDGENQFVFNLAKDIQYWFWPEPTSGASIGPWLGGRQDPGALEAGGSWQWVNAEGYFMDSLGNPTGYTAWQAGEPNNAIDQENALEFFGFGSGFSPEPVWNDFPEAGRILTGIYYLPRGFVVEKETVFTALPEWCNPRWHYLPLIVSP
jgi:hypothetical protein